MHRSSIPSIPTHPESARPRLTDISLINALLDLPVIERIRRNDADTFLDLELKALQPIRIQRRVDPRTLEPATVAPSALTAASAVCG